MGHEQLGVGDQGNSTGSRREVLTVHAIHSPTQRPKKIPRANQEADCREPSNQAEPGTNPASQPALLRKAGTGAGAKRDPDQGRTAARTEPLH